MKTDQELQEDVMNELHWDPALGDIATQIGVTAKNGMVTLSGQVDSYSKKLAAEKAAQRVKGVNVVALDMEVHLYPSVSKSDIEIAEMVNNTIRWISVIQHEEVEVKVENGYVTLSGTVAWNYERKSIEEAVKRIVGIKGIANNILLKPAGLEPKEIKRKISAAFHRSAIIDSNAIDVSVTKNKIVLNGTVKSLAEKKEAERAAWSSPGVTSVENNLIIEPIYQLM